MKFMSRIVERNETVMEKIVNTEEKLCQKWMFRNLLVCARTVQILLLLSKSPGGQLQLYQGVYQFTNSHAERKPRLVLNGFLLGCVRGAIRRLQLSLILRIAAHGNGLIRGQKVQPSVAGEDFGNVILTVYFDIPACLKNVGAIEFLNNPQVVEGRFEVPPNLSDTARARQVVVRGNGEVIYLA